MTSLAEYITLKMSAVQNRIHHSDSDGHFRPICPARSLMDSIMKFDDARTEFRMPQTGYSAMIAFWSNARHKYQEAMLR